MKKLTIGLSLAALAAAGAALAAGHEGHGMDPMGSQTLTRAQMQQHAGEMFARLDGNKDGKLDQADREAHRAQMFDRLDANNDGNVSRDEFAAGHRGGAEAGKGDGRKGMRGKHRGMGMMMLHMADANKDRTVTRAEFDGAVMAMFERADANKDGQVTPDERKAAHQKMREQMRGKMHGDGESHG